MADIVVPELGESVVEATVARWLKKVGDPVSAGETVVELETDKVDLEVGARQAGALAEIRRQEGEDVKVGEVLGTISEQAAVETKPAPSPGKDSTAGKKLEGVGARRPAPAPAGQEPEGSEERSAGEKATPVARRMAETAGIDWKQIQPAAPGEPVRREDVERFLQQTARQATPGTKTAAETPGEAAVRPAEPAASPAREAPSAIPTQATVGEAAAGDRREQRIRMSRRRRTIAARLVEAQQTAAILTTFNDVDMSAVVEIRKRRKVSFLERHGVKLGFMSFFVKAAIGALKEFPRINAELQGDEIVLKHYYDIGIAVGAEEGLVVPVLRDADRMTFAAIEKQIQAFGERARQGSLTLEDLRGGTFTITNGGVFGSLLSTPILNPPQVGILGLHRIEDRPVAVAGQVAVRPMMYLALSYDHRIVDGREAVEFLVRLKELIQDPEALLLEG